VPFCAAELGGASAQKGARKFAGEFAKRYAFLGFALVFSYSA
jgi:hypothetical protein